MQINKRIILTILIICFALVTILYAAEAQHNYRPATGYVPDEETAIKIAIAVWSPIYGKERLENEKPFNAILRNGIWYVSGSLPKAEKGEIIVGGVAEAEIAEDDGRIIRVSHGK